MQWAVADLIDQGGEAHCWEKPVLYTEIRHEPETAAALCGRDTKQPCPLLETCARYGYTEGVYADGMVYGGYTWGRGFPKI